MVNISEERYKEMMKEDMAWAESLIEAIDNDKRAGVKYKESRPITSIKQMLESSAKLFPDSTAFYTKFEKGEYEKISYTRFFNDINSLGTALIKRGYKDDRIGIIGETDYTWSVADLAVCCGTGIAVPIDKELPYDDIKNIINEAEVSAVFFDEKREPIFTKMLAEGDTPLKLLISQKDRDDKTVEVDGKKIQIISEWKLIEEGKRLMEAGDESFTSARIDTRETAIIIFTSGTTGMAKGIMLSHRNICADLMVAPTLLKVNTWDIFFSVLPIHHTYEYTCDFLMPIYKGAAIAHCEGLKYITKNLQEAQPTMFLGVPAIFEALHKQIWKGIRKKGKEKTARFGVKLSLFARNKLKLDISNLFFKEIKAILGGRMRMFISGGAAINPAILEDFQAFGIQAVQGYGLSECSPMGALNPDSAPKARSCGVALPGFGAKIDAPDEDDIGEICLKGDNIMLGYYKHPELTDEVIYDGWFHTGDLGYMDDEGYIIITGRKKNVIITKNGKNVFPEEIEYRLSLYDEVAESMIFEEEADNKEDTFIAAAIFPDWEVLREKLGEEVGDEEAEEHLWKLVDQVNKSNPPYKMIRKIYLRHSALEKNTSNKVVRFRSGNKGSN